jgi:hypothetical protein
LVSIGMTTFGRNVTINVGRAGCEACIAAWNLGSNSAFSVGSRKLTKALIVHLCNLNI